MQWTCSLDSALHRINDNAGPARLPGRPKKLVDLWNKEFPELAVTSSGPLSTRISWLRHRANTASQSGETSTINETGVAPQTHVSQSPQGASQSGETSTINESGVAPQTHVSQSPQGDVVLARQPGSTRTNMLF